MRSAENMAAEYRTGKLLDRPVLIFDGKCPVCVKTVERIRSRSGPDGFEFVSCHSEKLAIRFPRIEKSACLRAMHLVLPDGTVLIGEQAIPEILKQLRGYRWLARLFRLPGAAFLSRLFYRLFAKTRHHIAKTLFHGKAS